jgi:S1-C subfamily serine protease
MDRMRRQAILVAVAWLLALCSGAAQVVGTLRITVAVVDGQGTVPVPRYALLISDNPASAAPRRVITGLDGAIDVRLPPGSYTVESDRPFAFAGKIYQWTQTVDVVAGRSTTLPLAQDNAEVESAGDAVPSATGGKLDASSLWAQFADSVVALWTPTARASAFLVDARGLVATNQRAVGAATMVEVQIAPRIKVAARVLVADAERDIALLRIDPGSVGAARPVPVVCATPPAPPVNGQEVMAIEAPLRRYKDMTSGELTRIDPRVLRSDLRLTSDGAGGPVFSGDGAFLGMTTVDYGDSRQRQDARIVRVGELCAVIAAAESKVQEPPPAATRLPVEPERPFPAAALEAESKRRAGNLGSYRLSSTDFDVAFLTPILVHAAEKGTPQLSGPLMDFANWSEYVAETLPVVMIRVTPKLVEGFWAKVARGAAMTKGIALPPIKRFRSGFLRLRAFCGDTAVTPIHPFTLERRISESAAIYEGLYVFDPAALTPSCGTVKLELFSEASAAKGETVVVGAGIIAQVWQDFAAYRAVP